MAMRAERISIYLDGELITGPWTLDLISDQQVKAELRIGDSPRPIKVWVRYSYSYTRRARNIKVEGKKMRVYDHNYVLVYKCYTKRPKQP